MWIFDFYFKNFQNFHMKIEFSVQKAKKLRERIFGAKKLPFFNFFNTFRNFGHRNSEKIHQTDKMLCDSTDICIQFKFLLLHIFNFAFVFFNELVFNFTVFKVSHGISILQTTVISLYSICRYMHSQMNE